MRAHIHIYTHTHRNPLPPPNQKTHTNKQLHMPVGSACLLLLVAEVGKNWLRKMSAVDNTAEDGWAAAGVMTRGVNCGFPSHMAWNYDHNKYTQIENKPSLQYKCAMCTALSCLWVSSGSHTLPHSFSDIISTKIPPQSNVLWTAYQNCLLPVKIRLCFTLAWPAWGTGP